MDRGAGSPGPSVRLDRGDCGDTDIRYADPDGEGHNVAI